jgi:signal transduction histidine kinase/streptogramin lyase
MEDANGRVIALTRTAGRLFVNWFDGGRFHAGAVPASAAHFGENWPVWDQLLVQSRNGEWWCASAAGLLRFPAVDLPELSRTKAIRVYGARDNLGTDHIYQIFEDSRGRLWISTRTPHENGLIIRDPASGSFRNIYESDGIPALNLETWANHFFEDRAGQVWIGLHRTGVIRYAHGKFRTFSTADGVPPGGIRRFHQDQQKRLWLGSGAGGAARIDDPEAEHPRFVTYNTAQGLSGNEVQAIAEDRWGRIYLATGNIVDRLDPATGRVRSYSQADGLARGEVQAAVCDRRGNLWFATVYGVSTLVPDQDDASTPPPVRIVDVSVGGVPFPIRESPGTEIVLPDVVADRNRVEIGFGGISFIPGEVLRYEYLLEGADASWKQPTRQRSVIYESVRPGHYRFLVRAIDSSGALSLPPAAVRFHVLAPLWMRWWSLALLAASAGGILYAAHRYRTEQLLEIERMRLRLASDLHDELGSGLASIGVLSEFANQGLHDKGQASDAISRVAEISRELLESMGDLLWSLDPRPDSLGDLTGRMRAFANDMLAGARIELDFRSTGPLEKQKIDPEERRQIYLIFREAIHNVLRHARCNRVAVEISCADGRLVLSIRDDGVGFDAAAQTEGRGIESMHRRAENLRGRLEWKRDQGTNVILTIPLHK